MRKVSKKNWVSCIQATQGITGRNPLISLAKPWIYGSGWAQIQKATELPQVPWDKVNIGQLTAIYGDGYMALHGCMPRGFHAARQPANPEKILDRDVQAPQQPFLPHAVGNNSDKAWCSVLPTLSPRSPPTFPSPPPPEHLSYLSLCQHVLPISFSSPCTRAPHNPPHFDYTCCSSLIVSPFSAW